MSRVHRRPPFGGAGSEDQGAARASELPPMLAALRWAVQRSNFSGSAAGGCCCLRMRHLSSDDFANRVSSSSGGHSTRAYLRARKGGVPAS